jgi:hypothetical protein
LNRGRTERKHIQSVASAVAGKINKDVDTISKNRPGEIFRPQIVDVSEHRGLARDPICDVVMVA